MINDMLINRVLFAHLPGQFWGVPPNKQVPTVHRSRNAQSRYIMTSNRTCLFYKTEMLALTNLFLQRSSSLEFEQGENPCSAITEFFRFFITTINMSSLRVMAWLKNSFRRSESRPVCELIGSLIRIIYSTETARLYSKYGETTKYISNLVVACTRTKCQ